MPEVQETQQPTMEEYVASRAATAATTPTEKVESAPESATGKPESEEEKKAKGGGWQRRIDKLTKRGTELEESLNEERAARQRLEAKLAGRDPAELSKKTVEQGPRPRPKATDAKYQGEKGFELYEDDLLAWQEETLTAKLETKLTAKQKEQAEATEQEKANQETISKFQKNGNAFKEQFPEEYEEILAPDSPAVNIPAGSVMDAIILNSEMPFQILKHLCDNPEEITRIAQLPGLEQAEAMFEIKKALGSAKTESSSPEPKKASLPAPIRPVSTSTSKSTVKPQDMSMEDYANWRKANR